MDDPVYKPTTVAIDVGTTARENGPRENTSCCSCSPTLFIGLLFGFLVGVIVCVPVLYVFPVKYLLLPTIEKGVSDVARQDNFNTSAWPLEQLRSTAELFWDRAITLYWQLEARNQTLASSVRQMYNASVSNIFVIN